MHLVRVFGVIALGASFGISTLRGAELESRRRYVDPDPQTGTSKAVITENLSIAFTRQILPIDESGKIPSGVAAQTELVLSRLPLPPECDYTAIVKLNVYIRNTNDVSAVREVLGRTFRNTNKPAASFVITSLPDPEALIAMDAVAAPRARDKVR